MLRRTRIHGAIKTALSRAPVVLLVGPRQCGKTTLARQFLDAESVNYFDLESPESLARLDQPQIALEPLRGLVVIDEVQLRPDLFPLLRTLADRHPLPARFLILGSASGEMSRQTAESLAGRRELVSLGGFTLSEVTGHERSESGTGARSMLWRRGGLPPSYLARSEEDSVVWRRNFIRTLLERDFPQWGIRVPAATMGRFWAMLAHYHGQIWNAAEPARAIGLRPRAIRHYLDILTDAMMVRQLHPWFANIRKRQVKAPKIYLRDSGLLHQLLGVEQEKGLLTHPRLGASWEGFVIEQVLQTEPHEEAFFWSTHQGAEMDLILRRGDTLYGIECKFADAPRMSPSIRHALTDVGLSRVAVLYPGRRRYPLSPRVEAVPISTLSAAESLFASTLPEEI